MSTAAPRFRSAAAQPQPSRERARIRRLRREELPVATLPLTRYLIGKIVVRETPAGRMCGRIVEAEAYPPGDPASHHFRGPTPRIQPMYLAPGHAYIFFNYGNHFMLNVVSEPEGIAGAILIGALEETGAARRGSIGAQGGGSGMDSPPRIRRTVRIGISRAAERLFRFYEQGNPFVSGPKRLLAGTPAKRPHGGSATPR